MPDPERPYIVTKGVDLLKKVAETNGIKADPEEYLKRSNGNYSDAMDIMLDENGYEPYDEATKKQIHDNEQLPILSSDYILKNRLSDAEQKDLETQSNEIFDKLKKGYGTETFGYEKVQNFKYDEKDKVRLRAELNTINERLRRDSELRDLMPKVINPDPNPLGQKSLNRLKKEINENTKEVNNFTPSNLPAGLSLRDEKRLLDQETLKQEKRAKAEADLIELDKEDKAPAVVITANTAAVTAKALGNDAKNALYVSKGILYDNTAKLQRQKAMADKRALEAPTEENIARVQEVQDHLDAQLKEIGKGDSVGMAVNFYSKIKAQEKELQAQADAAMDKLTPGIPVHTTWTFAKNLSNYLKNSALRKIDAVLFAKDDTFEEHQKKRLEEGVEEANTMQQSDLRGNFKERYVEVDGQRLVIDNAGDVLYGVDKDFRPTNADISKYVAAYEANPDKYERKFDYDLSRLVGSSAQVAVDMLPIIAANTAMSLIPGVGQVNFIRTLGNIGASYVSMFGPALKKNLEYGKGYDYAHNTAMMETFGNSLIEVLGGYEARTGKVFGDAVKSGLRNKLKDLISSYGGRSLADTDFYSKAKGVFVEYLGETGEEIFQSLNTQVMDHFFYGTDIDIDYNEYFNTATTLVPGMAPIKVISSHIKNRADRNMMRRGYNASLSSPDGFKEVVDAGVAQKSITEKEASIKKEVLAEAQADYDAINSDKYDHITKEGKNRLVSLMADRDMNRMMAKYIEIGPGKETYAKKAEELDKKFRDLWKELDEKGRKNNESGHGDVRGINFDVETIKDEDNERQESGDVNGDTQGTGTGEEVKAEGENKGAESQAGGTNNADSGGNAEGAVSVLTKEAEDLLSDPTKVPVFISKNLERIAKENGIEITGSMTGADVINALKQKRDGKATNEPSGVQREATTPDGAGQPGASAVDPAGTKQEAVQETVPSGNKMSVLESTARKIILNQELTAEEKQERANNPTEVDRWVKVNKPYLELSDRIDRLSDSIEDIKFRTNYDPSIPYQDSEGNQGTITIDNGGKAEFVYKGGVKELGNISGGISENMRRAGIVAKGKVQPLGGGQYSIDGVFYKNNLSDPARAINIDKEGNVVSVDLDEVQGGYNNVQPVTKSKTFTGPQAEELAYQIHLEKISKDEKRFIQYVRERGDGSVPTETQEGAVENNDGLSKGEDKQGEADKQAAKGEVRPEEQEVKRTLSGLTEEERLAAVEARKKETKFSDTEKGMQEFWSLVDRYEGLIEGARGKSSTSGQQLWGDILQKSKPLKIEVTRTKGGGVTKVVAKKGGKRLKNVKSYKEGNYKAISPNEDKALLDNRSGKVQDIFSKLYHNLESPGIQIEYGVKLSDVQKEQAFNDVADGIPSNGAEAVLNVVEKFVQDGNIIIYDESMGTRAIPIDEFFGNQDLEWLSQQGVSKEVGVGGDVHKQNIHDKFRKEFEAKGVPKEQVDGAIALMEARAKSWASEEKGRNPDDWYSRIADVKSGEFVNGSGKQFQVEAYHGSPHDFDKFSTSKVGTGEGAQAFGYGLYFTDLKGIAEEYARRLSNDSPTIDGKKIDDWFRDNDLKAPYSSNYWMPELLSESKSKEEALSKIDLRIKSQEGKIDRYNDILDDGESTKNERAGARSALEVLEKDLQVSYDLYNAVFRSKSFEPPTKSRNLYKVSLHEGKQLSEYDWLEWDKPVSEKQKEKVKSEFLKEWDGEIVEVKYGANKGKFISEPFAGTGVAATPHTHNTRAEAESRIKMQHSTMLKFLTLTDGKSLYKTLGIYLKSEKSASEFLLKSGIDGVKYPAESIARGATSDNARGFNYVVFDDKAVTIKEKIQFQNQKGAVETLADGRKVIHALDAPDFSTMVHEIAHVFEGDLTAAEQKIVKDFGGSEPFARGFERYIRDGESPTPELKTLFDKFKEWLTNIYKTLKGSPIEKRISPEIKQIFDRLLTEQKAVEQSIQEDMEEPPFMINNGEVQNARKALDNATKRLREAEKRIAEANGVQMSAFNAPQGSLFGVKGEDIKAVIDPLKKAVKKAREVYDKAVAKAEAEENAKNGQQSLFQKEKRKLEPIDTVLFNKLLKNLNKAIPGVFGGVLEKKAFGEKLKEMHGISMRDKKGIIYGFVGHDGKVYLNGDVINANTPIHEYGHIFINIMKDKFPQVYRRGLNLADKSPYLSTLLSQGKKSDYAPLIDRYKNGDKTALQEEALAMAIGDMGERMVQKNMKNAFLEWVDKMWTAIKRVFGGRLTDMTPEQLNRLTFKQFSNLVAGQLLVGDPVGLQGNSESNDIRFQVLPDGSKVQVRALPDGVDVVNGFYSPIEKRLVEIRADKMPVKQWIEKIGNKEEAMWIGLTDWLGQQTGSVSKADIQSYLKNNRIEIVEVVNGGEIIEKDDAKLAEIESQLRSMGFTLEADMGGDGAMLIDSEGEIADYDKNRDAYRLLETYNELSDNNFNVHSRVGQPNTKYSQYQLEGENSNYREVLVTLPKTGDKKYIVKNKNSQYPEWTEDTREKAQEYINKKKNSSDYEILEQRGFDSKFQSTHFDEPNILVHLRMNIRTDAEGNKVLFLEELQSDWGQKGKKEGFQTETNEVELEKKDFNQNAFYSLNDKPQRQWSYGNGVYITEADGQFTLKGSNSKMRYNSLESAKKQLQTGFASKEGLPTAPFVTETSSWTKLGLKVALKEAVKQGADKIAWTTGEQQNDRYDLSKQVDWINAEKTNKGDYKIEVGHKDNRPMETQYLKENELEANLGKELATKIINDGGGMYRGLDLKVGGKGMKGFYGSPTEGKLGILGEVARSLFKQEPKTVEIESGYGSPINSSGDWQQVSNEPVITKQHAIDITPEMREQVGVGLPLFQIVGEKGAGQLDNAPNIVQAAKRLDNLEVAKNMESKVADARTIFLATGWQKGGDGKWKTEIGDITFNNLFEGDNPVAMQIEDNGFVKLGDLVSGEVLDAYPYLKDVPVKFVKGTPGNGQYDGKEIKLQYKSEIDFIINEQLLLKALAHEVQHFVQDQEGFAKGTTSDYFTEDKLNYMTQLVYEDFIFRNLEYDEYIKQHGNAAESVLEPLDEWEDFQKEAKKGKDNVTKILADAKRHSLSKYRKVAGEVEANNVMKRMDMPLSERLVKTFTDTEDVAEDEKIYLFDSKISNSTFDLNKYKAEKRRERAEDNVNRAKANLFNAWNNLKTVGVVSDPWQNSQNMKRVIDAAIELAIQVGAKTKEEIKAALNDVIKKHNLSPNQLNNIARAVKAYSEPFDQDIFNDLVQNTDSAHEAFGFLRLMRQNTKDPIKYGKVLKLEDELTKRQIEYEESQQVPEGTENNTKAEILKSFGEALTSYKMPLSQPKDVAITGAYNPLIDNEVFGTTMQASMLHATGFVKNWFDLFKARDISTKAFFQEVADYLAANPGSIYSEPIANASYRLLAELKRGYKNDKYWDSIYDIMNIPAQAQRRSNLGIALALGSQESSGHAFSGKLEAIEQFKAGLNENLTDEELDENNHGEIKRLGAEIHEEEGNRRPIPPPGYLQRKARRAYKEVEQSVINRVKEKIKGCK